MRNRTNFPKEVTEIARCGVNNGMPKCCPTYLRPRWIALLWALWGWSLTGGIVSAAETIRLFNVPADTADKSLKSFSQQAELEVIFSTRVTREVTTKPIKGEMTGRQALDAMLAGTGLVVIQDGKTGAFTVSRASNEQKSPPATTDDLPGGSNRASAKKKMTQI